MSHIFENSASSILADVIKRDIPEKLKIVISELEGKLIEREELIRLILLCIFSKNHAFLIGEAGTGKTYAIERIASVVKDGVYWEKLLNNETKVAEIIGDGVSEDKIDKTIARAHFAFLDEMFKAPQELLNSLLAVLNERRITINGEKIGIPLNTVFSASNEFPQGAGIDPFEDRFLLWYEVKLIQEAENQMRYERGEFDKSPDLSVYFNLEEIKIVEETAKKIKIPEHFSKLFMSIKGGMKRRGLKCSDRKFGKDFIVKAITTSAVLNSRDSVNYSDYTLIRHYGWSNFPNRRALLFILTDIIYGNRDQIKKELLDIARIMRSSQGKFQEKTFLFLRFQEGHVGSDEFDEKMNMCHQFLKDLEEVEEKFTPIKNLQTQNESIDRECDENIFVTEKLKNPFLFEDIAKLMNDIESDFLISRRPVLNFLEKIKDFTDYQLRQYRMEQGIEDDE